MLISPLNFVPFGVCALISLQVNTNSDLPPSPMLDVMSTLVHIFPSVSMREADAIFRLLPAPFWTWNLTLLAADAVATKSPREQLSGGVNVQLSCTNLSGLNTPK